MGTHHLCPLVIVHLAARVAGNTSSGEFSLRKGVAVRLGPFWGDLAVRPHWQSCVGSMGWALAKQGL